MGFDDDTNKFEQKLKQQHKNNEQHKKLAKIQQKIHKKGVKNNGNLNILFKKKWIVLKCCVLCVMYIMILDT